MYNDEIGPHTLKVWILENKVKCAVYGGICFMLGVLAHAIVG